LICFRTTADDNLIVGFIFSGQSYSRPDFLHPKVVLQ
jgi:hypothetical protein